jgi:SAM-dependent methyltransferase
MLALPITRLRGIYARHGLWGALGLIPHNARMALRAWSPKRRRAHRREREFDRRHGIDTATPAALASLGVDGASLRHAVEYKPSGIEFIRAVLGGLAIAHDDYTFVDLGSGKGRALLLAAHLPFRRIVGVEFSARLTAIARANIAAYRPPDRRCHDIEAMCGDAAAFVLPDGPLVVYLYNAFDDVILGRVAANLAASLAEQPRDLLLIYVNPVHRAVLDRLDCLAVAQDRGDTVIYRSR